MLWTSAVSVLYSQTDLPYHWTVVGYSQGLRASSLQFTSPLEFNAIFRDGFTLRHELTAGSEIRDPVTCTCTICCDYVTYVPALKFPKSWLRTLGYRQKIHHFFFSHKWGTRFKYLSKLCRYILMYSALHIMQWFSQLLDVFTPKIKRKFFNFYILWIKTNVAYTRLEMIARTKYFTTTTASNWFVTLYYKLLPAVRSSSKHGRWWSSLLLYSISMDIVPLLFLTEWQRPAMRWENKENRAVYINVRRVDTSRTVLWLVATSPRQQCRVVCLLCVWLLFPQTSFTWQARAC